MHFQAITVDAVGQIADAIHLREGGPPGWTACSRSYSLSVASAGYRVFRERD